MDSNSGIIPRPSDIFLAIAFALTFVIARFFLHHFIFTKLAAWLLSDGGGKSKIIEAKIEKWSESMWKLTYYVIMEFSTFKIIYRQPWFSDIKGYFQGWPNQENMSSLQLVYMCQCGFYIYSIVALLLWETRRKDFYVTMSHHILTAFLIAYSYITRFFRIGSVILALHDASDILLEAAKVFRYSDNDIASFFFFGVFAISWVIFRLILFPFWFIRATSYHLLEYLDLSKTYDISMYYTINTMLLTLLVFHIYWWFLICSTIKRQLKTREFGDDIRSDSEDND